MNYELTKHAQKAMEERGIRTEWLERTLSTDATVERYFCPIPEFGGRILRVAVNTSVEPTRVVSVFFDRAMKGKL